MVDNSNTEGGYDYNWVTPPPESLLCLICLCVAREPRQHGNRGCGRVFCESCVYKHMRQYKNCPHCRTHLATFFDDRSEKEIKSLRVRCSNAGSGCSWTGELRELETHLPLCGFVLVPCTNECTSDGKVVRVLRKDLSDHVTNRCPKRQYKCPHCEKVGEHWEKAIVHAKECPNGEVKCPNFECEAIVSHSEIPTHRATCEYELIPCKYAEVGCRKRPIQRDLKAHEEDDQQHLRITIENNLKLQKEIKSLQKEVMCLKNLQGGCFPITFRVWNISEARKINHAIRGQPFYTSPTGYKMGMDIFANGYGAEMGNYVSVFVYLMKGENDRTLPWPFAGTITIELLNQLEDKNHHKVLITFDETTSQRVLAGERGVGVGSSKFIPLTDLGYQPANNCHYAADGSLVFRVTVQTPSHKPWLESSLSQMHWP